MKKYTVITIVLAALLSIFLLGMNPVNQPSELLAVKDGIWRSDTIEGYDNAYTVVFHTEDGEPFQYVVQEGVSFGEYLPEVPAKENKKGAWLIDGTVDSYLTADTPLTTNISVTAVYSNSDYMAGISGMIGIDWGNKLRYLSTNLKANHPNTLDRISEDYLSDTNLPPFWSFTYAGKYNNELNYYYVNSGNGYLNIAPDVLSITSTPQKIVVTLLNDGRVILGSENNEYKLNYDHGNGLFKSAKSGGTNNNEKFTFYDSFRGTYTKYGYEVQTITFNANGGAFTPAPISGKKNSTIQMPGYEGVRYGYKFLGWASERDASVPEYNAFTTYTLDASKTFYAVWQRITPVTISLDANGGMPTGYTFSQYPGVAVDLSGYTVENGEHAFLGWADENGTLVADPAKYTVPGEDTTLHAVWDVIVDINANGGSGDTRLTLIPGEALDLSELNVSNGLHVLQGWATMEDGPVAYAAGAILTPSEDTTLYAVWDSETIYVVFFDGGSLIHSVSYPSAEAPGTIALPSVTERGEDYLFLGWSETQNAREAQVSADAAEMPAPAQDTNLYSVWQHTVTITFEAENTVISFEGENNTVIEPSSLRLVSGTEFPLSQVKLTLAEGDNREFDHWYDGRMPYLEDSTYTVPEEYATLTAEWKAPKYTITFNLNSGTGTLPASVRLRVGESFQLPGWDGTRTDYTFLGWAEGKDKYATGENSRYWKVYRPGEYYTLTKEKDITLYAYWNENHIEKQGLKFGLRTDGIVPHEPNGFNVSDYTSTKHGYDSKDVNNPGNVFRWGVQITQEWVLGLDTTEADLINGYVKNNEVVKAVGANNLPTVAEVQRMMSNSGGFDPKTQYVVWYVLKYQGTTTSGSAKPGDANCPDPKNLDSEGYCLNANGKRVGSEHSGWSVWHVDGVVCSKNNTWVTYKPGLPAGVSFTNMPANYSVHLERDANGNPIKQNVKAGATLVNGKFSSYEPKASGYIFLGWKVEGGDDTLYKQMSDYELSRDVTFVGQWRTPSTTSATVIKSWADEGYADAVRPDEIKVSLWQRVGGVESRTGINGKTLPNSDGTWTFTANNLPQYNSETADTTGTPIVYFWREDSVPDQYNVGYNDVTLQTTITNTFTPVHVLEVTKTADKTEDLKVGETVTYTITVTAPETNNVTISNLLLADALEGVTCGQLSATSLAPGASATAYCAYTVTQADVDAGTGITNTVTVTGTDPAGVEVSDNDSVTVSTEDAAAELTLTKAAVITNASGTEKQKAGVGDTVTYTVTVSNSGNVTVSNITITDDMMPAANNPGSFTLAPQDEPVTVTYTYTVTQADVDAGSFTNTASAAGKDPQDEDVSDGPATVTILTEDYAAELTLKKTAVITGSDGTVKEKAAVGDTVTYTVTVENTGNVTVSNIDLADTMMPAEVKPAVFTLAPGENRPVEYTYTVTQDDVDAGSFSNTASAEGKDPKDGDVSDGPATVTILTEDYAAELTLTKTAVITGSDGTVKEKAAVGDIITYSVTVRNTGNVTVSNINLTDAMMPESVKPAAFTLAPGASLDTVTYTYTVTQADVDAGSVQNTVTATGKDPQGGDVKPEPVSVPVPTVDAEPELTITKTADKTSNAEVNDVITYSVVVTNTGNVTVSNITLDDSLVEFSAAAVLVDGTLPEGNWQPFVLAPEEVKTVTYSYSITQTNVDEGKVENTASVSGTDPQGNPVTPEPVSETVTTITPDPKLEVNKTAVIGQVIDENGEVTGKAQAELDDVIAYVVKVKNTGNVTVTDIAVEDTLVTGWGESIEHFSLAPNEEKELTHYSYRVQQSDVDYGTIENKATATGHYSDQTVTDDADANVATLQNPGLTVEKSVVGNTAGYKVGDTVQYIIRVTNTGNVTLTNVHIVDRKIGGDWTIPEFAPNAKQEYSASYIITVADVVNGNVVNTVNADATAPNGGSVNADPAQATVTTEKIPLIIRAAGAEKVYDGTPLMKNDPTTDWTHVSGILAAGNQITSVTLTGSQTNRGTSENVATGAVIIDGNGIDVSAAYDITYEPGTLTVKPRPVTVTANNNEKVYGTADPAFSAVVSAYDEANQTGLVGNDEIPFTLTREPGEDVLPGNRRYVISAEPTGAYEEQGGSFLQGNYLVTYYTGLFEISPKPLTITAADATQVFNGKALTKNEYFSSGSIGESGSGLVNGDILESVAITGSRTDVGYDANVPSNAVIMNNGADKTANYAISYVNGTLTVTPRPVTVRADEKSKIWGTPDPALTYSIDEYIENVNEHSGLVAGDTIVPLMSREAGEDEGVYTIYAAPDGTYDTDSEGRYLQGNYAVAYIPATLSIGRLPLVIIGSNLTETYNGQAWTKKSYQPIPAGMLLEGDHVGSVTVKGSQTLVGTSPNTPSNAIILDAAGNDVTARYQITYTPGTLNVTKADIIITAMDAFKYYDGTPLTKNGPSDYSQTGLISGDVISSVTITGSRTEVGEADNIPSNAVILHDGVDVTDLCYNVTYNPGKLIVAEKLSLIITADSETKKYDGITLTKNSYTVTGLDEGDSVDSVTITGSLKLVGEEPNVPSNAKIVDKDGNDITVKYDITYINGLLKVTPKPLTVTASGGTKVYDGTALKVNTYTSSGLVENDTIETITITGSQIVVGSSNNVPEVTIIKNSSGENVTSCYTIEHINGTLTVTPKKVMIIAGSDTKVYDGTELTKTDGYATMSVNEGEEGDGLLAGDHIASLKVTGSQTNYGSSDNVPSDAVIVNASGEDVTANYEFVYGNGTLTVTQRPITITADSAQKYYDGKPLTKDAIVLPVDNLVTGHNVSSVTVIGSQTKAGGNNNNIASNAAISDDKGVDVTNNYIISYAPGTLKVLPLSLTITAASGEKIYDGTALTKNGENDYTHSPLAEGDKITQITLTGTQTIVGKSANIPSAANIVNGAGESVMSCYTITWVRGELKVNPRPITIIANSDTKVYDGTALTADGYTTRLTNEGMTGNVLGEGDHIDDVTITGSQTVVGNSNNVPSDPWIYDSEGRYANGNYEITFVNGTLEVTPKTVTITAASDSKVYDGTALTKDEILETVGLAEGDVVSSRTVTGSQTIVGSSNNVPSAAQIKNAAGEDVTGSYNINYLNGTLAVTRRQITITAGSGSKEYDGTPLKVNTWTITSETGLGTGDSVKSVVLTGEQTVFGTSANTASNAKIVNANGEDVTASYEIHYETGTLGITKKPITITADGDTKVYDGTALRKNSYTNTDLAAGDKINEVNVTGAQTVVGTSNNVPSAAKILNASNQDVTASYEITYANSTLEVTPKAITITADSDTKVYDGTALTKNSYTNDPLASGDKMDSVTVTGSQTVVGKTDNVPSAAKIVDGYGNDVTTSYTITYSNGELEVTPKAVTITADSGTKVYDGTALTKETFTNTALADGDKVDSVVNTGSQTVVGSSDNVPSAAKIVNAANEDVTASYAITYANGKLEVTPKAVTVTADSDTKVYDGTALTKDSYTNTDLAENDSIEVVTVTGSQTVAGTSGNVPSAAKIVNADGEDVTASYAITYVNGTLEVTPKTLTITADGDTKVYDGTALTKDSYTIVENALAEGDTIDSVILTGTQTVAGSSDNVPSDAKIVNAEGIDVTDSYNITYVNGSLEVTPQPVTITADSDSKIYDGTPLTKNSYTNSALAAGDSISAVKIEGSQTVVGSSYNVARDAVIINAVGADVTGSYEITYVRGVLEVLPNTSLIITANSDTKVYDGTALTNNGYTHTILAPGDRIESVTVSGSQTIVGNSANVPSAAKIVNTAGVDVTASYGITYNNGTLTVTPKALTITANSDEKVYDGQALTNDGYTYTDLAAGDRIESAAVNGSQTIVGQSANVPTDAVIRNAAGEDVTASYAITYVEGSLKVTPKTVTITAASDTKVYDGKALTNDGYTNTALAAGDNIESVNVEGSQTIVGSSANIASAAVIHNAAGDDVTASYTISYTDGTLEVTPKTVLITALNDTKPYDGTALTRNEYTNTELAEGDSIEAVTITGSQIVYGTSANVPSEAKIVNAAGVDVTTSYTISYANGTLEITRIPMTITAGSDTKMYDGTPLTNNTHTDRGLVDGDSVNAVAIEGSQTNVGSSPNVASNAVIYNAADEDVTDSYIITHIDGLLEVTADQSVIITAASDTKIYDGTELTNGGYTITKLAEGDSLRSVDVNGSQTIVGESANVPSNAVIVNAAGVDVTGNYGITYVNGTLTVTPKALTITANSDSKIYDGIALTNSGYTNTALSEGDSIESVTVTGSQTIVGSSDNVPSAAVIRNTAGEDVTHCYAITYPTGTLSVTPKALTITAASDYKVYDGEALTNSGYTNSALAAGDSIESVNVEGSQTIVGSSANIASAAVIHNATEEDVTASYAITYVDGTLTVTPKALTITAASDTKIYDGTALTNNGYTNTTLSAGDSIESVNVEGSQTIVGSSANIASAAVIRNAAAEDVTGSYAITYINGTLEVTKRAMIITAGSATKIYDGTPLTNETYTDTGLVAGDSISSVTIDGSQTNVGTSANVASNAVIVNAAGEDVTVSYDITYVDGLLEVTATQALIITAASDSKTYDGTPLMNNGYTFSNLMPGDTLSSVIVRGTVTNAGTMPNIPSTAVIVNADGEDVTNNYSITYVPGMLVVTPRALKITAASDAKVYDGIALTDNAYNYVGLAENDHIESAVVGGSQTNVGTHENKVSGAVIVNAAEQDVTANYSIEYVNGELAVTPKPITITAKAGTKVYDAKALTVNAYTATATAEGDSIRSVVLTGSQTYVGTSDNVPSDAVIRNEAGQNVNANYTITYVENTLEVTPMRITITAAKAEKVYDGIALTNNGYTNSELAEGDRIVSVVLTGSQTNVGTSANVPSEAVIVDRLGRDVSSNYEVTYVENTLTVTPMTVRITAGNADKMYDGKELTENSFSNSKLAEGDYVESAVLTGSQINAGSSANTASQAVILNAAGEDVTENYTIIYEEGKLTVTRKPIVIIAASEERIYDSKELTNDGYTVEEGSMPVVNAGKSSLMNLDAASGSAAEAMNSNVLAEGDEIESVNVDGRRINVGSSPNVASDAVIINGSGENVTDNYMVRYVDGKLTVTPKPVTVTAQDQTKEFGQADKPFTAVVEGTLNDDPIAYTITREAGEEPGSYPITPSGEVTQGNYIVTYIPATLTITYSPNSMVVSKVWVDDDNRDGLRPVSLTVTLTGSDGSIRTRRLNDANNWTAVVDDLPLYFEDSPVEYTWSEEEVSGYTGEVSVEDNMTVFTNTHEIARTSLSVNKIWEDNGNVGGTRPEGLGVRLQSNGTTILSATLNETNGWSATVNNLPMNENGSPIVYSWTEQAVSGYYPVGSTTSGSRTTFTNSNIYTLTIHYIYENGEQAHEDYTDKLSYGATFSEDSPEISGFVADNEVILGTMPSHDIEFTVIYTSDGTSEITPTVTVDVTETPIPTETPVPTLIPYEEPEVPKDIPEPRINEPDPEHPIVVPEPSYLVDIDDLDTALGLGEVFINNSGYALE